MVSDNKMALVEAFQEINNSPGNGLAVITSRTGSGKSYAVTQWIAERLGHGDSEDNDEKYIYITPSKKNWDTESNALRRALLKRMSTDAMKQKVLLLRSEADEVSTFFNQDLFYETSTWNIESTIEELDELVSQIPQDYRNFKHQMSKVVRAYLSYRLSNFEGGNNFFDDSEFSYNVSGLKKMLAKDVRHLLGKKRISNDDVITRVRQDLPWVLKMLPDLLISERQVIIMTSRKFLEMYKGANNNATYLWTLFKHQRVNLILDESDAIKVNWNDAIIDQIAPENSQAVKDKIDLFHLYRRINRSLSKCLKILPEEIISARAKESNRNNEELLRSMQAEFPAELGSLNLMYRIVLDQQLAENHQRFLFHTGGSNQLFTNNQGEQYLVLQADRLHQVNVIKADKELFESKAELRLTNVLRSIEGKIKFFFHCVRQLGDNIRVAGKRDWTPEEATRYVLKWLLDESGEEHKTDQLLKMLQTYSWNEKGQATMGIPDNSIYNRGYEYLQIVHDDNETYGAQVFWHRNSLSAEKLLSILAQQWRVYCISATADSQSPLCNFDLRWVEERVNRYHLFPKISQKLIQENDDYLKEGREKGVRPQVEYIDSKIEGQSTAFVEDLFSMIFGSQNLPTEIYDNYPGGTIKPTTLIHFDGQDSTNLSFNLLRDLKVLKAIIQIINTYQQNPLRPAYVIFRNQRTTADYLDWFNQCLRFLKMPTNCLVTVSAQQADQLIPEIQDKWTDNQLKIIMTPYATLSRGINLDYMLGSDTFDELIDDQTVVQIGKRYGRLAKDIDGLYLERPTHLATWVQREKKPFSVNKMLHIIGEQDALYLNGEISRELLWHNLYTYMNDEPAGGYRQNSLLSVQSAASAQIEQAVGRMARTNIKDRRPLLLVDEDVKDNVFIDHPQTHGMTLAMQSLVTDLKKHRGKVEQCTTGKLELIQLNQADLVQRYFTKSLPLELAMNRRGTREKWRSLRQIILRNPVGTNNSKHLQRLYWHFSDPVTKFYYANQGDYEDLKTVSEKPVQSGKILDLTQYGELINRILKKNPWLKQALKSKGYYHDFTQPSTTQLLPGIFNNFYRPAFSEEVFHLLCDHLGITVHPMEATEFELFDGYLVDQHDQIVYFDIKDYNDRTNPAKEQESIQRAAGKLANCAQSGAVYFINFCLRSSGSKYRGQYYTYQHQLAQCPFMFDHDGKLNRKFVENLLQFFK